MDRSAFDTFLDLDRRHFWRRAKRTLVLDLIDRHAPDRAGPTQFLDVGAACSLLGVSLAERGDVRLVEPDGPTAALARDELGLEVVEGHLPDGLPEGGPYDVITALDVIEHVDDDVAAVAALVERLHPDGLLVVTVPALQWLWSDHDVALHHRRRYVAKGLREVLGEAGLEIGGLSYYTSLLLPVMAAARLPKKLKTSTSSEETAVYDVKVPPAPVNTVCSWTMAAERRLMRLGSLPYGASLVAWGRPA